MDNIVEIFQASAEQWNNLAHRTCLHRVYAGQERKEKSFFQVSSSEHVCKVQMFTFYVCTLYVSIYIYVRMCLCICALVALQ